MDYPIVAEADLPDGLILCLQDRSSGTFAQPYVLFKRTVDYKRPYSSQYFSDVRDARKQFIKEFQAAWIS